MSAESVAGLAMLILFVLGFLLFLAIYTWIIRWVFRVNEMVRYQQEMAEHLAALRCELREKDP